MRIDVTTAEGAVLDYLVCLGIGVPVDSLDFNLRYMSVHRYSADNELAGEVMDRERISTLYVETDDGNGNWWATTGDPGDEESLGCFGPTRKEAAMRAYAAHVHGETYVMDDAIYLKLQNTDSIPEDDHLQQSSRPKIN